MGPQRLRPGLRGLLLVCGRAGDLYGRRLLFLAGLGALGAVPLLGGFAQSPGVLVLARFLQDAAAAAFVPTPLSLLTTIFAEGRERNRTIGAHGTMAALGFVVGGRRGGVTELLGWRRYRCGRTLRILGRSIVPPGGCYPSGLP